MADPLDLLERDYRDNTRALDVADHSRTWANTFSNTPPAEVLRANRNYDDLMATAIDQRMKLGALTDPKQQKMYYESRLQPLKEDLVRGQIEHQAASTLAAGATTKFQQQKDTETMGHIVGFADYMEKAPSVDSPEYSRYVLQGVQKFPRMATTEWGKSTLGKIAQEHDTIQSLKAQIPEGFEIEGVTVGGGKQSTVTAKRTESNVPAAAKKELGELNAEKASKTYWLNREKDPVKKADLQAAIDDADVKIQAWHDTYNPKPKAETPSAQPSATPKRLKFNPQTGKLE